MEYEDASKNRVKFGKIILNLERCSRLRLRHVVLSRKLGHCPRCFLGGLACLGMLYIPITEAFRNELNSYFFLLDFLSCLIFVLLSANQISV